jgi:hypothetical protein
MSLYRIKLLNWFRFLKKVTCNKGNKSDSYNQKDPHFDDVDYWWLEIRDKAKWKMIGDEKRALEQTSLDKLRLHAR